MAHRTYTSKTDYYFCNGFNANGQTALVVGGNTYSIKDQLKSLGYKYDSFLKWHGNPDEVEEIDLPEPFALLVVSADRYMEWNPYLLDMTYTFEAEDNLANDILTFETSLLGPFTSEWLPATEGERLRNISVTCTEINSFDGKYGHNTIYTFYTDGNRIMWSTTSTPPIDITVGHSYLLTGTVKSFDTTKYGEKQTRLNRCVLHTV